MNKQNLVLKIIDIMEDSNNSNLRVNLLEALQEELKQVEEPQEEQGITKEDILKIKDSKKRIQAINENKHLF